MSSQRNIRSKHRYTRGDWSGDSNCFFRKTFLFLRLAGISALLWGLGYLLGQIFCPSFSEEHINSLYRLLDSPFYGCSDWSVLFSRLFFCILPSLAVLGFLLCAFFAKQKQKALFTFYGITALIRGWGLAVFMQLLGGGILSELSIRIRGVFAVTAIAYACLYCVYTYRLLLCITLGFPKRSAVPGTFRRFFSYTIRLILWILILNLIRFGMISIC